MLTSAPRLDEERRRLDPAKTGGEVERRLAGRVAGIDLRAAAKEDAQVRFGPEGRRGVQRCLTGQVAHPDVAPCSSRTSAMAGSFHGNTASNSGVARPGRAR